MTGKSFRKEIVKFFMLIKNFSCIDQNLVWDEAVLDAHIISKFKEDILSVNKTTDFKYKIVQDIKILEESLELTKSKKLIKEYSSGLLLTELQIKQLLNTKDFIKDGRLIIFESFDSEKYSALYKSGEEYFYFDATDEDSNGEIQVASINDAVKLICKVHYSFLGRKEEKKKDESVLKLERFFPLGIKIFSFDEKKVEYPDQKDILETIKPTIVANKCSSLSIAASIGNLEAIQYFLEKGADPNFEDEKGNTPLILGSKRNDLAIIEKLILFGADPNMPNKLGNTPLLFASYHNHTEVVKILLLARANPNITCNQGWTALELAAKYGYVEIVKDLLITRASINIRVWNDCLALINAASNNHIEVAKLLLKAKFDVNTQGTNGNTALMCAIENNNYDLVYLLLKENIDVNMQDNKGRTALMLALSRQFSHEVILKLLEKGADVNLTNNQGETALMYIENVQDVGALIARGAKVNAQRQDGKTALSILVGKYGTLEICKEPLIQGVDPNIQDKTGQTALSDTDCMFWDGACDENVMNTIKELLRYGANPNSLCCKNLSVLMRAIGDCCNLEVIKVLVSNDKTDLNMRDKHGDSAIIGAPLYDSTGLIIKELLATKRININAQDNEKTTCLMIVAEINDIKSLKLLLEAGANPNLQDENGWTALMYAVDNNSFEAVKILISNDKVDVNKMNNAGETALRLAVRNCSKSIIQELLNNLKVDINMKDEYGRTALMIAARQGNLEIVNMLLNKRKLGNNAELDLADNKDRTALSYAVKNNHVQIVNALLLAGANPNVYSLYAGETTNPLFIASANGYIEIIKLLLAQKCTDFCYKDKRSMTALMIAVLKKQIEVVKLLLANADIKKTFWVKAKINGQTALMLAASDGCVEIVRELLEADAAINAQSEPEELTALMLAAANGHVDVVKALLSYKSKGYNRVVIDIKNKNGKTASDLAASDEIRILLVNRRAHDE